jgi:hypothetical protein
VVPGLVMKAINWVREEKRLSLYYWIILIYPMKLKPK